jgi:hypothetical protein
VLESTDGVEAVWDQAEQIKRGVWHARSGDFLVTATSRAWFAYPYWEDDARAPDFARTVDIHRKPGYDPAELLVDPAMRFPHMRVAKFLLKKKLGFRALLELTPLDPSAIRGSHGRIPDDPQDYPVIILDGLPQDTIDATEVYGKLLNALALHEGRDDF